MKSIKLNILVSFLLLSLLTACKGGGEGGPLSGLVDWISPDKGLDSDVQTINQSLNQDPNYNLSASEIQLLENEGIGTEEELGQVSQLAQK